MPSIRTGLIVARPSGRAHNVAAAEAGLRAARSPAASFLQSATYPAVRILIIGIALLYVCELLVHGMVSAVYPYDLNYAEGYILNDSLRLLRGEAVWADITQFPMVRSPYPPLYLVVVGLLSFGNGSFVAARTISLAATVAIGLMIAWRAREIGAPWHGVASSAGLWFGSTFVYQWAPLARVDVLGLAFALAGVLTLVDSRSPTWRRILLSALCCALALCTKQTLVAAPVAVTLWLALRRDWRALPFAALVGGAVGFVTLAFNALSGGQYVQHVIFGNAANPFDFGRVAEWAWMFAKLNVFALALVVVAVGAALVRWRRHRNGVALIWVYAATALATIPSVGNVSSDVNYLLEPTVALALLVGWVWREAMLSKVTPHPAASLGASVLCLAQLVLLVHIPNGFMSQYPPGPAKGSTPVAEDVRIGAEVEAIVREAAPMALVEPAGFSVLAGSPVWIQPIDLRSEKALGRWTAETLVDSIRLHRWRVVVLNYKFLPDEVMDALEREYRLDRGLASPNGFSYFVYRPGDI